MSTTTKSPDKSEKPVHTSARVRTHAQSKGVATTVAGSLESVQQFAGNLAIQQLLNAGAIKAKLTISQPNDPDEQEADAVADRIMRMPEPTLTAPCPACSAGDEPCQKCSVQPPNQIRRKANGTAGQHQPSAASHVIGNLGTGHPLDKSTCSFFEPRLGANLSHVRVHTDQQAAESARSIKARAFTSGNEIAFASGEFRPNDANGRQLLAHELAHVTQGDENRLRRDAIGTPSGSVAIPPPNQGAVTAARDIILDALEGYTSASDSENILNQFRGKGAAMALAIMSEVKNYGALKHGKTPDEMVDWLLGDMTAEHRRDLRQILVQSRSPDIERIIVVEIKDRLEGYTSEADSAEIYSLLAGSQGTGIDALLVGLETAMKETRDVMRTQLFGDLDRTSAERLRQLFFAQGGPIATAYAAAWTARKIMDLIEGYTSHSDSTDIVWNFRTTPTELRGLVQVRLEELCSSRRGQDPSDVLMHDMDASDYERLRTMGGLTLKSYKDTRSTAEKIVAGAEWVEIVLEWTTCSMIGLATGLVSAAWDILRGIKDIVIAVWDLIWSLVYVLSFGAVGSENWLRVKTFFIGIGNLFSDPGKVWDEYWNELALDFHTIEGPLGDCRRAEFVVRKFVSALVNVALIFAAGYGIAKGAVAGVRAAAEGAELAELIGVRGVISVAGRLASRRIGRFVAIGAEAAAELLKTVRQPLVLLRTISARLRVVLIAAEDAGYWRYLRQQAGVAVQAVSDTASEQLAGERRFWEENRRYWRERGLVQQAREQDLGQELGAIEQRAAANERPDPPTVIDDLRDETQQLGQESATLHSDVAGKADLMSTPDTAATPSTQPLPPVTVAAPNTDIDTLITEALGDFKAEPPAPLNPADFGPAPRRVVARQREIDLNEIPPARRGYYKGAGAVDLGRPGVIEQGAGHVLEKVVDTRLPGSSNTADFPNPFGDPVIPDHLPPGNNVVFLDPRGYQAKVGTRFSARFVGDSKYKDYINVTDQTRGFVNLARFTDESTLVFYVRWQDSFPAIEGLTFDQGLGGHVLPVRPWNEQLVSPSLREFARTRGVKIRLVSDPMWR